MLSLKVSVFNNHRWPRCSVPQFKEESRQSSSRDPQESLLPYFRVSVALKRDRGIRAALEWHSSDRNLKTSLSPECRMGVTWKKQLRQWRLSGTVPFRPKRSHFGAAVEVLRLVQP
ncbi:hypothetical protein LWI28_021971 [Acer negundo]|uniref:Uncharacterized protein n=1 Tax=Acer negundo TaxID=4023 RepID=A0AAD5JR50_ACENE|nr:hypothetical protein LWI28_021971 [Acer negundo]